MAEAKFKLGDQVLFLAYKYDGFQEGKIRAQITGCLSETSVPSYSLSFDQPKRRAFGNGMQAIVQTMLYVDERDIEAVPPVSADDPVLALEMRKSDWHRIVAILRETEKKDLLHPQDIEAYDKLTNLVLSGASPAQLLADRAPQIKDGFNKALDLFHTAIVGVNGDTARHVIREFVSKGISEVESIQKRLTEAKIIDPE